MKVSVLMITYNHEKFIGQALDSALMQSVDFDYEVVIGEDRSTDGTREIIAEYAKRHPDKVRVLDSDRNIGMLKNYARTLDACKGKYIAVLDGDDFWTSPFKLKKQADYLDAHPESSMCFHKVASLNDENGETFEMGPPGDKDKYSLRDLLSRNFIANCSVMYRAGLFARLPDSWFSVEMTDWTTHVLNAQHGDIGYIDEVMGVYRVHRAGVWSMRSEINNLLEDIKAYQFINAHLGHAFDKELKTNMSTSYYKLAVLYHADKAFDKARDLAIKSFLACPFNRKISRSVQVKTLLKFIAIWFGGYLKSNFTASAHGSKS